MVVVVVVTAAATAVARKGAIFHHHMEDTTAPQRVLPHLIDVPKRQFPSIPLKRLAQKSGVTLVATSVVVLTALGALSVVAIGVALGRFCLLGRTTDAINPYSKCRHPTVVVRPPSAF